MRLSSVVLRYSALDTSHSFRGDPVREPIRQHIHSAGPFPDVMWKVISCPLWFQCQTWPCIQRCRLCMASCLNRISLVCGRRAWPSSAWCGTGRGGFTVWRRTPSSMCTMHCLASFQPITRRGRAATEAWSRSFRRRHALSLPSIWQDTHTFSCFLSDSLPVSRRTSGATPSSTLRGTRSCMITGASQANVRKAGGIQGQTRQHSRLIHLLRPALAIFLPSSRLVIRSQCCLPKKFKHHSHSHTSTQDRRQQKHAHSKSPKLSPDPK